MKNNSFGKIITVIRNLFKSEEEFIPLHEPRFWGNEKKYINDVIDSTFVSSVGEYVDKFETKMCEITGAKYAIATVNGTSAIHISLLAAGVKEGDEVLTQGLTFVATANAIKYCNADPVFIDVDESTLGFSPYALKNYLQQNIELRNNVPYNKISGKKVAAILPMHTFGHPCKIDEIVGIAQEYNISVVEDAAESLGSYYKGKHTGTFSKIAAFSFNGNKITTAGGGGCIVTNDAKLAKWVKHITTTAKIPHAFEYNHDEIGYNYRMPNLNAALVYAQLEQLPKFLKSKRSLANKYIEKLSTEVTVFQEPEFSKSNYWLNTITFNDKKERDDFLSFSNKQKVMTRPIWNLMWRMPMFADCLKDSQNVAINLEERIVNIPSSVI